MPGMFRITDINDDYECPYGFKEKFSKYSIEQLIDTFNRDHWKNGFVSARGYFYLALERAFLNSGYDCSSFISEGGYIDMAYPLRLEGNRVVQIRDGQPLERDDPANPETSDGSNSERST